MRDCDYLKSFDGVPVVEFEDEEGMPAPDGEFAWAVRTDAYDGEEFGLVFERFLANVDPATVTRLVIGCWGEPYDVDASVPRDLLIEAAPKLPGLKAVYFGDIAWEESEISWIEQRDITPLLQAYPGLERLDVHGAAGNRENGEPGLRLSPVSAPALRVLRFESGGLPAGVVRGAGASDLPGLETLEMWLGVSEYGGDATIADLAGILSGERLPSLRRLGLMDSEIQDEICAAVATAPVVARLHELDLSMGVLTDDGAEALLSGQPLTHLRKLNLEHHFMTEPMVARLREAIPCVWAPPQQKRRGDEGGDRRYVAVAE